MARIVAVAPGPPDAATTFSGIAPGLLGALRARGALVAAVDGRPGALRRLELAASIHPDRARWRQRFYGGLSVAPAAMRGLTGAVARRRAAAAVRDAQADWALQLTGWYRAAPAGLHSASYHDGNLAVYLRRPDLILDPGDRRARSALAWERGLYDSIDVIFTMSEWLRRSFVDDFGQAPEKVVAIGAGSNAAPEAVNVDREWTTPRLLFVGRDWERKGGPELLRAWPAIRSAHPEATLEIVGPQAIAGDLPAGVEFTGWLDRDTSAGAAALSRAYRRATVFVMPSLYEPFGIVFLEAMAHGLPCVGGDSCAMPEIVADGSTGFVVDPRDGEALTRALLALAEPETARRMGAAGQERLVERFTWDQVASRMVAELEARS